VMLPIKKIPVVGSGNFAVSIELDGQKYQRSVRIFQ